jgi:rhodanese-related sulfurtransferase
VGAAPHVPGASSIPRGVLEFEVDGHPAVNCARDPALAHRDQPIVLYCRSGGRSALAAEALLRLGFAEPLSLAGGYVAWTEGGGEVEGA